MPMTSITGLFLHKFVFNPIPDTWRAGLMIAALDVVVDAFKFLGGFIMARFELIAPFYFFVTPVYQGILTCLRQFLKGSIRITAVCLAYLDQQIEHVSVFKHADSPFIQAFFLVHHQFRSDFHFIPQTCADWARPIRGVKGKDFGSDLRNADPASGTYKILTEN